MLRFLAEDMGKELGAVLDSILRSLSHVGRRPPRSTPSHSQDGVRDNRDPLRRSRFK